MLRYKGRQVSLLVLGAPSRGRQVAEVSDCNQFYVTLTSEKGGPMSFPLSTVVISFDHSNSRLELQIYPAPWIAR